MSRAIDVVHLSGDEYDRLMDERELLRQEAARAWREVDAIAKERDDHHRWRKDLADQLGEVEKQRNVLARTLNTQETELQALRKFAQAYETLRAEAEALRADAALKRDLLLWALYHAQGGSSRVGQAIRRHLGIEQHARLTPEQIKDAERAAQEGKT